MIHNESRQLLGGCGGRSPPHTDAHSSRRAEPLPLTHSAFSFALPIPLRSTAVPPKKLSALELKMLRNSEVVSPRRAAGGERSGLAQHEIEWLTAKEAAAHLRVKARTILLWTRQGKLRGYALSGGRRHVWRYLRKDLDAALLGKTRAILGSPSVLVTEGEQ